MCNVPDNNFGITLYFKKQGSLVFQADPEVTQSVKAMLISLVNTQSDGEIAVKSVFNLLNVLHTSDDPNTSSAKLQGETSDDLSGLDKGHNSEMGSDDSVPVNKLLIADIEGIKLDVAILQSQMSNISDSGLANFFISANSLLRSKQNDLEKIIKTQELLINNLKQENLFIKSNLSSLEQLLFAENPEVQASVNLSGCVNCLPDDKLDAQENSIAPSPAISTINEANMNTLPTKSTLCISTKSNIQSN